MGLDVNFYPRMRVWFFTQLYFVAVGFSVHPTELDPLPLVALRLLRVSIACLNASLSMVSGVGTPARETQLTRIWCRHSSLSGPPAHATLGRPPMPQHSSSGWCSHMGTITHALCFTPWNGHIRFTASTCSRPAMLLSRTLPLSKIFDVCLFLYQLWLLILLKI
jgi:hypothetical protein